MIGTRFLSKELNLVGLRLWLMSSSYMKLLLTTSGPGAERRRRGSPEQILPRAEGSVPLPARLPQVRQLRRGRRHRLPPDVLPSLPRLRPHDRRRRQPEVQLADHAMAEGRLQCHHQCNSHDDRADSGRRVLESKLKGPEAN